MKSSNQLYNVGDKVRINAFYGLSFCGTVLEVADGIDGEEFYCLIEWHYTDGSESEEHMYYCQEDLVLATARTMYEALVLGMDGNVNDILKEEAEAV